MGAQERRTHLVEVLATTLLAVSAVATAWTTAQVTRWRDEHSSQSTKATTAHIASSQASIRAGQKTQVDLATFIQWVDANELGRDALATFYRRRFRPEFRPAFDAWLATKPRTNPQAPPTPFAMPEYRVAETARSEQLTALAVSHATEGRKLLENADDYLLALVLFASALFFAGISTKVPSLRQREVLLGIGCVIFIGTAVWVATLPITLSV